MRVQVGARGGLCAGARLLARNSAEHLSVITRSHDERAWPGAGLRDRRGRATPLRGVVPRLREAYAHQTASNRRPVWANRPPPRVKPPVGREETTRDLQKPHLPQFPFSRVSRHLYTIPDAPEQFLHSFQPSIQPLRPSYDVFRHTLTFSAFSVHTWALSACLVHTPTHQGPLCSAQDIRHASAVHKRTPPPLFQSFVPSHMPHGSGAIPTCTATRAARPDRAGRICSLLSPQLGATAADSATSASASGGHFEPGGTSAQPAARGAWPTRPRAARVGASVGASRVGARRGWAEG